MGTVISVTRAIVSFVRRDVNKKRLRKEASSMAGIDKTYVKSWEDYVSIRKWAESVGEVKDDFGNTFSPLDWMSEYEEIEFKESLENQKKRYRDYYSDPIHVQEAKEWNGPDWEPEPGGVGELVLWNTPTYFDIWLIRECPLDFIQDRLKQQYGKSYTEIKERRSEYDQYVRPAASSHFRFSSRVLPKIKSKWLWWNIRVKDFYYDEDQDKWYHWLECREYTGCSVELKGSLGKRKLARKLKKWGFPAGTVIEVFGNFVGLKYKVTIKK